MTNNKITKSAEPVKSREIQKTSLDLVQTIPVDPVPFNNMSRYFSIAATVMDFFQVQGVFNIPLTEVRIRIGQRFPWEDSLILDKVAEMVLAYYRQYPPDGNVWKAKVGSYMSDLEIGRESAKRPTLVEGPGV